MAARKALAARPEHKMIWPRERRWPLNLITKRYWPRKNRRSYRAPTASVSRAGRIARRQLPYRAPIVSRADSFRIARRSYRAPTASVVPPVSCLQILWWPRAVLARADSTGIRQLSSSSTLVALNSFDCAASLRKRRPSAAGSLPRTHSAGPVVSDLLSPI